jgi:hypothetical protein
MEPTVLFFQAARGEREERFRQVEEYAQILRDPIRLARLRSEISRVALRFEADTRHELYERNDQHAALHEQFGAALEERDRLLEQEAWLRQVEGSRWWRLGQRLEPLRRAARAVRPRR